MIIEEGKTSDFGACAECGRLGEEKPRRPLLVQRITLHDRTQMVLCKTCSDGLVKLLGRKSKKMTQRILRRAIDGDYVPET